MPKRLPLQHPDNEPHYSFIHAQVVAILLCEMLWNHRTPSHLPHTAHRDSQEKIHVSAPSRRNMLTSQKLSTVKNARKPFGIRWLFIFMRNTVETKNPSLSSAQTVENVSSEQPPWSITSSISIYDNKGVV